MKLREIQNEKEIIEKINSFFSEFKKRSALSYEKVTIIIGKEMGIIKEGIKKFFKDTENIVKNHQEIFDLLKTIRLVEIEIKKSNEIKKIKSEIIGNIEDKNSKITNLKEIIKTTEKAIENLKKSEKFIEESKKREELETKKQDLERSIGELSRIIDFKFLTNFYHSFEKEMSIVKEYKENFKQAFQKTGGEDIISLLSESKLQNVDILNKTQEIEDKTKEISKIIIEETGLENLENSMGEVKSKIDVINSERFLEEKKLERLEGNLNEIIKSVKSELIKINVNLD